MTAEDIETWWLLTSGRSGKQKGVTKEYRLSPTSPAYTHRENEVEWTQRDNDQLLSMVNTAVAQNTSARALKKFLTFFGAYAKTGLADTTHTLPTPVFAILAKDSSVRVRETLARRNDLPEPLFDVLAADKNYQVRAELARNPKTPARLLRKMFDERNTLPRPQRRFWGSEGALEDALAQNPNIPEKVHKHLLGTKKGFTQARILSNPLTTSDDIADVWNTSRKLSDSSYNAIMGNTKTPKWILEEHGIKLIATRWRKISWGEEHTLLAIASNPSTPLHLLNKIHQFAQNSSPETLIRKNTILHAVAANHKARRS